MILHLIFDDKFADYAIQQFVPYGNSRFLSVTNTGQRQFRHIKHIEQVDVVEYKSDQFLQYLSSLKEDYNAIIIHGFYTDWQADIVNAAPRNVKVAWAFWGGDIYQRPDVCDGFLAPRTAFLDKLHRIVKRKRKGNGYNVPYDVYGRVDYVLDDSVENYEYVLKYIGRNSAEVKYLWYAYYSIEETVGEALIDKKINGNNVLLGHTAGIRTNHLDGFAAVKRMVGKQQDVIVPLSYGIPWYRNILLKTGCWYFGKNFRPLTAFLPRNEYNELLLSCAAVVFPTYKPEAMGNCLTALWLGARLYMYKRNLQYQYFKRMGLVVFSIEDDLKKSNKMWDKPLDENSLAHNRKVLSECFGKVAAMKKIDILVKELDK